MSKTSPLEDARARAEKIRSFKTDIQKMKKEKEEADLKRLEALKLERQKRIAARGSSSSARSTPPSSQTRRLPTKLSPSSVRGSKFSDTEPGSSSPLQRTKIRTPTESHDSQKASKSTKVSDGHLANDRLTRSASSLSDPNKESNGVTPDSKTSKARLRRLSEPKTISSKPVASVKAQRSEPVSKPRVRNSESASKSKLSDYPESKKISAIMDLDKKKAATLPELKIRTPKEVLDVHLEKSAVKDTMKVNDSGPSGNSESTEPFMKNRQQSDVDDRGEKTAVVSEYAFIDAPPSPFEGFVRDPIPGHFLEQLNSQEAGANSVEETPKFASIDPAVRPHYQAPYARVSSIEERCTGYSEYAKAPPANSELASVEPAPKAYVDDAKTVTVYNIQEGSEKAQVKEPSKGFKRLLKFAKKSQSSISGDRTLESDSNSAVGLKQDDNATSIASSSEVYTLKNLISQDEVPSTGNAVQKSRHFSLLSPFRSKTTEKKPAS
nr:COP1-interacting protein 7 [Ipomoea batatas]